MKTTFIYLALVVLNFNQTGNAKNLVQQDVTKQKQEIASQLQDSSNASATTTADLQGLNSIKGIIAIDTEIFNPNSVIKTTYEKRIEEVIAENNLITQANQEPYQPIVIERTQADDFYEYNQIIENNTSNEVYPLDFEKINSSIQCSKIAVKNETTITDLKL